MIKRTVKQIHAMAGGLNEPASLGEGLVHGVTIDSRKIMPDNLFVPLKGANSDGHVYVEAAIKQGAAAALWQANVPNPPEHLPLIIVEDTQKALQQLAKAYRSQLSIKVVGITGSNGKTTTKDMTAALLSTVYKVGKTSGNYNNHLGLPLTLLSMDEDTEVAVLEMGMSSRGEIDFLSKLAEPDVAVITNIGESHLLDLGSREEIAKAKLEITEGLSEDGTLIYLGDEPLLSDAICLMPDTFKKVTFGRDKKNDLYPISIEQGERSTAFTISSGGSWTIPVLGNHNVLNALAAILAARELGVDDEHIQAGLEKTRITNMRMELAEGAKGEKIINDAYNASPTSVKAAIELIEGMPGFKNKYLILGDMLELGPQEKSFHKKIGELINPEKITRIYTYGPLASYIAEGALAKFGPERVCAYEDKQKLIERLSAETGKGDLVLVKASRGMKLEEVVEALQQS